MPQKLAVETNPSKSNFGLTSRTSFMKRVLPQMAMSSNSRLFGRSLPLSPDAFQVSAPALSQREQEAPKALDRAGLEPSHDFVL